MLATFKDTRFTNTSYRSQVAFGYGEDLVLAGDEAGCLWAWRVIDVRSVLSQRLIKSTRLRSFLGMCVVYPSSQ